MGSKFRKETFGKWWGPKGLSLHVAKLEFKPGGMFLYKMSAPDGFAMWARFVYTAIHPKTEISFILSFTDENGHAQKGPGHETWPLEIANTITFREENGKTSMTIRGRAVNATAEEIKTYVEGFSSMEEGFGGTYDQLDEYLTNLQA